MKESFILDANMQFFTFFYLKQIQGHGTLNQFYGYGILIIQNILYELCFPHDYMIIVVFIWFLRKTILIFQHLTLISGWSSSSKRRQKLATTHSCSGNDCRTSAWITVLQKYIFSATSLSWCLTGQMVLLSLREYLVILRSILQCYISKC